MNKVCVLMSTYNGELYVKEQIESILNQEQVEIMLYIRDDGSTDKTLEIIKSFQKKNSDIILFECQNIGVKKSFFELLKLAPKADFYAFADQDDVWKKEKLSSAVEILRKDSFLLYFGKKKLVDKNLKDINIEDEKVENLTLGATLMKGFASGCTMVFTEKLKNEALKFNINNFSMHDTLMLKIASCFNNGLFYDRNEHILYRQHEKNAVGSTVLKSNLNLVKLKKYVFDKQFNQTKRFESAKELLCNYENQLVKDDRENLILFIGAKKNILDRIKLCFKHFILGQNRVETLIFKIRLFLGLI